MLILYYLFIRRPLLQLIPYLLQVVPYFFILKKLGLNKLYALVPFLSEYQFTRKVYPKKRTFIRPFLVASILVGFSYYVSPHRGAGRLYLIIAFIIYSIFLVRLYNRLSKAFGKKWYYTVLTIVFTPVMLLKLGIDKSVFTAPEFKPEKPHGKLFNFFKHFFFFTFSTVELLIIIAGAGFLALRNRFPVFLVNTTLQDAHEKTREIVAGDSIVTRNDMLENKLDAVLSENKSREYYAPDHSQDESAVVYVYVIGSNLEDGRGLATANINQMKEASKQGTGVKFVIEAGGSERWFTDGIQNSSYGRYELYDGTLTKVESLPGTTNMSDGKELTDFLTWGKNNYSSDRSILVLWDHGGGVQYGYGQDSLNGSDTMSVSQLVSAIDQSGLTFDIIGFDACLMQDIEIAKAIEPYADYYIGSEEVEGGYGWTYTYAFGNLAKDPGMSSEELGRQIVACYDPYNTALNKGEIDTGSTLSLVDLPVAAAAYDKLSLFFDSVTEVIPENPQAFANISLAADNSYNFSDCQIDLVGFLQILDELDYSGKIYSKNDMDDLIEAVQASVICHNKNSAEGINGISFAFGNAPIEGYSNTSQQLEYLSEASEKKALDIYYSIIGAMQLRSKGTSVTPMKFDLVSIISAIMGPTDYSEEEWYITGFENYDDTDVFIDIPLTEVENGYKVELPKKTWDIISDTQTMVYQRVSDYEGAYTRYLGNDYLGGLDEDGHYLISSDTNWVHVNGQIVCYEADKVKITKAGEVYTGKIKARLNNTKDIYLIVEWDPVEEDAPEHAHVIGYIPDTELNVLDEKGTLELNAGDSIQFLFNYYDEEGNFLESTTAGKKIRITKQEHLKVTDEKMEPCTIEFGGVLKDVYQRLMTTEMIVQEIN